MAKKPIKNIIAAILIIILAISAISYTPGIAIFLLLIMGFSLILNVRELITGENRSQSHPASNRRISRAELERNMVNHYDSIRPSPKFHTTAFKPPSTPIPTNQTFRNMNPHQPPEICQCGFPRMEGPHHQIVSDCAGCGKSFIRSSNKWIMIEDYLDPDHLLNLETANGFSPEFVDLFNKELKNRQMAETSMRRNHIVTNFLYSYEPWKELAKKDLKELKIEEALFAIIHAMHDYPSNPGFWFTLTDIFIQIPWYQNAKKCFQITKRLAPDFPPLKQLEAKFHAFEQKWNIRKKKEPNLNPKPEIINNLAVLAIEARQKSRALIHLKKVTTEFPSYRSGWLNLGSFHGSQGHQQKAQECFETALALDPNDPNTLFSLGILNFHLKNLDQSEMYLRRALENDPTNSQIQESLQEIMNIKGRDTSPSPLSKNQPTRTPQPPPKRSMPFSTEPIPLPTFQQWIGQLWDWKSPNFPADWSQMRLFNTKMVLMLPFMQHTIGEIEWVAKYQLPHTIYTLRNVFGSIRDPNTKNASSPHMERIMTFTPGDLFRKQLLPIKNPLQPEFSALELMWNQNDIEGIFGYVFDTNSSDPYVSKSYYLNTWLAQCSLENPFLQDLLGENFGNFETLADLIISTLQLNPIVPEAYTTQLIESLPQRRLACQRGDSSELHQMIKERMKIDPLSLHDWLDLGSIYLSQKDYMKAKKCFRIALIINPYIPFAWAGLYMISIQQF
ncbi:tetratricopeptide repeat protein [Candidatus Lokiarchaeum ossiferum]|uniref:tetratricopeptide repeat protein n=1 Tax=Candidatus Lokiarchaeum ossiferum TaxID=2951803 RepID=UPI00352CAAFC